METKQITIMDTREKGLELAKLMGWEIVSIDNMDYLDGRVYDPYLSTNTGLAQFAEIILRFPEVVVSVRKILGTNERISMVCKHELIEPTQENILDEILRMNGQRLG